MRTWWNEQEHRGYRAMLCALGAAMVIYGPLVWLGALLIFFAVWLWNEL
jgi:hypothetical protein